MRKLSKTVDIILYLLAVITLLTALSSAIWKKPVLFVSVRSNSMYPLFQRSDVLLIKNLTKNEKVNIGDIIVFKSEDNSLASQGWIVHRIIEGNDKTGYITKGDANEYTDQDNGRANPIKRENIAAKVITINRLPIKIPLIGYLSLWMEKFQKNPYAMPIIAVILAVIIGINELLSSKKGKKKRKTKLNMDMHLLYFFGGLTLSMIIGASMLASSQRIIIPYEISADSQGVIMGSNVGIVKVGERIEKPLIELSNRGFFPFISTITTKDEQITFSHSLVLMKPGSD
ncbi:MAG TPA: signal peptidase I [Clostridiales bacterium]|nr:signal peptidase I [Clostridiales bacterium]